MLIPEFLVNSLYQSGSLKNTDTGVRFVLRNQLRDAELVVFRGLEIDAQSVALDTVRLEVAKLDACSSAQLEAEHGVPFPVGSGLTVEAVGRSLEPGKHNIEVTLETRPFGELTLSVQDVISEQLDPPHGLRTRPPSPFSPETGAGPLVAGFARWARTVVELAARETGAVVGRLEEAFDTPASMGALRRGLPLGLETCIEVQRRVLDAAIESLAEWQSAEPVHKTRKPVSRSPKRPPKKVESRVPRKP